MVGNGWLTIGLGAYHGRLPGTGDNCDNVKTLGLSNNKYCDPFVKIYINDKEVYETAVKDDVQNWTTYDEMYFSNKISKQSSIKFHVLDKNPSLLLNTTMFEDTLNVETLVKRHLIQGDYSKLYVNAIWKDEYEEA